MYMSLLTCQHAVYMYLYVPCVNSWPSFVLDTVFITILMVLEKRMSQWKLRYMYKLRMYRNIPIIIQCTKCTCMCVCNGYTCRLRIPLLWYPSQVSTKSCDCWLCSTEFFTSMSWLPSGYHHLQHTHTSHCTGLQYLHHFNHIHYDLYTCGLPENSQSKETSSRYHVILQCCRSHKHW